MLIKYYNEQNWQRERMKKSNYFTEFYLKNRMVSSGKEHDLVGGHPDWSTGHWHCKFSFSLGIPVQPLLRVSICAQREELGNPDRFHLYKLYEKANQVKWEPLVSSQSSGMSCLHHVLIDML